MNRWNIDGVNVFFFDWKTRKISGWSYNIKVGDLIHASMQSGKVAEFRVTEINRMNDPKDQYFGTVEDVRYL